MLSKRLQMVADLVRPCGCVADVGTDHGYLIGALLKDGVCRTGFATDINQKPLESARRFLAGERLSDRVELRLCDGLDSLPVERIDEFVLAGMGGELIADIVSRSSAVCVPGKGIVCQPMSRAESLRRRMAQMGFAATAEKLVWEDSRLFVAMRYEYMGEVAVPDEATARVGRLLQDGDPLAAEYIRWQIGVLARSAEGAEKSAAGIDTAERFRAVIRQLEEML